MSTFYRSFYKVLKGMGCLALSGLLSIAAHSQDTGSPEHIPLQERYLAAVNKKAASFNSAVDKNTGRTLDRIIRQEKKMQKKVAKIDSVKAKLLFAYSIDSLEKFKTGIKNKTGRAGKLLSGPYFPYLDTLRQSLGFLHQAKGAMDAAGNVRTSLDASLQSVNQMESGLATADKINEYLRQRESVLQEQLTAFPALAGNLGHINKEAACYQAQISEYKLTLQDPDKIERLALNTLEKLPAFQKFFQQNGQIAGLFSSPAGFSGSGMGTGSIPVVNGLPSRAALQTFIRGQLPIQGLDPAQFIQQQAANAGAGTMPGLDDLISKAHGSGTTGNGSLPDFTPDAQQTKSFRKRLEFGANLQFGNSTNFLPATSTIGMQTGYKLNDRSSLGIGLTYTTGMGTGWNHIRLSNEAVGLRTYMKWKPMKKKTLFLQGGAEWNYLTQFKNISQLQYLNAWQTSALLGLGKTYKINKKISGDLLLVYDFLYDRHIPATRPLLMRLGYNF